MNPAIDKLVKYFRLEAERGHDNRAVVGGLQKMLEPWEEEARQTGVPEQVIEAVVSRLRDYPRLTASSREEALSGLLNRLKTEFPAAQIEDGPRSPSPPTVTKPPEVEPETETAIIPDPETQPSDDGVKATSETVEKPPEPETVPDSEPPEKMKPTPESMAPPASLGASLTAIAGVGPKSAKTLRKLKLETLGDLLWHLPRRYDDYSQLKTINRLWFGEEVTIIGTVEDVSVRTVRSGRMKLVEAVISDGTGSLRVTWFNQQWIANRLKPGRAIVLSGKVDQYLGRLTMNNPEWEALERKQLHTNRIVPVYPLTAGVSNKWIRRMIHTVVTRLAPRVPDHLPESVRLSAKLLPKHIALQQVHFPDTWDLLRQAQHRLAFDEMFLLQLGVLREKRNWEQLSTAALEVDDAWVDAFQNALPYTLTDAQRLALADIRGDLANTRPMNRLLQGDVGSGKTVIAAAAAGITAENQAQAALMAPTSILAEQHYATLLNLLPEAVGIPPEKIVLLVGATAEADKEKLRLMIANGEAQIVVGTHALLEDPIAFEKLGLVIIDEQHRFGVEQRAQLRNKGENPNLLVMTATPIPRSLALTIYGDLDLSVIDEMPPGRISIETRIFHSTERTRAHRFILGQLEQGRQAFIIYPLVEGSEKVQAKAAVDEHERLQSEVFSKYSVGLLHGRMRPDDKESIMSAFRHGEHEVLVSTSVVEVGVDIPNATVMLIEGANHFGLAQLHQFRGRVGRGEHKSFCILIPDNDSDASNERLEAMESTTDGFELAELDLKHRGPGDFLGTRQSGFAELRTAQLTDIRLIEKARREAQTFFAEDPELKLEEHSLLAQEMARFWSTRKGEIS
jgi:ATP-dependent DNA helicase RecG